MTLFRNRFRVESARRPGWDYGARGWYFVTICTKDKQCSLGTARGVEIVLSEAGSIARDELQRVAEHYSNVIVDRFVIMPNHVHTIIAIEGEHVYSPTRDGARPLSPVQTRLAASPPASSANKARSLADIVGGYKAGVTRLCHAKGIADFAWQSRFHDQILRSNAMVNAVRDYIDRNPENWLEDPARATCVGRQTAARSSLTRPTL